MQRVIDDARGSVCCCTCALLDTHPPTRFSARATKADINCVADINITGWFRDQFLGRGPSAKRLGGPRPLGLPLSV
jgi:hypothetical protein